MYCHLYVKKHRFYAISVDFVYLFAIFVREILLTKKKLFMKNFKKLLFLFVGLALVASCDNDDDAFVGAKKVYVLSSFAEPTISGTATFTENQDKSTTVELQLIGTPEDGMHPAHIHLNTAAESGAIALTLGTVNGTTGFSTVTFSALDNGTAVSFANLLDFNGYINVHLSADALGTIVAQGDIGQNELTGTSKEYALDALAVPGISGSATFYERNNGDALAILEIENTLPEFMHPAHIHMGSVATAPGSILLTFSPVNGNTGISRTNVSVLNDETPFGYSDVLAVDGYINVHLSAEALGTIVAQGNIGVN